MKKISEPNKFQCKIRECPKTCSQVFPSNRNIITVSEKDNKGKTAMLCILIDMMKTTSCFHHIADRKRNSNAKDKTCIFQLKGTDKKVGITTTGDMCYCLAEEFAWMQEYNCDLYICASHLSGGTLDWLMARTKNGYLLRLGKATVENLQGQVPNVAIITEQAINMWQA